MPHLSSHLSRPIRNRTIPAHFNDFHVDLPANNKGPSYGKSKADFLGTHDPLSHFVSYSKFTISHSYFLMAITQYDESLSYQ